MDQSAFALLVSTAIQQAVEIIEILFRVINRKGEEWKLGASWKRLLALGLAIVPASTRKLPKIYDFDELLSAVIWAIALSAGTEGVNSILKYLSATKDNKKLDAADKATTLLSKPAALASAAITAPVDRALASALRAQFRSGSTRDRVVDRVEAWCDLSGFQTNAALKVLWDFHHATSAPFQDQGILLLCAAVADEFNGERNLTGLVPSRFKPNGGGTIDTVDDLVEAVKLA